MVQRSNQIFYWRELSNFTSYFGVLEDFYTMIRKTLNGTWCTFSAAFKNSHNKSRKCLMIGVFALWSLWPSLTHLFLSLTAAWGLHLARTLQRQVLHQPLPCRCNRPDQQEHKVSGGKNSVCCFTFLFPFVWLCDQEECKVYVMSLYSLLVHSLPSLFLLWFFFHFALLFIILSILLFYHFIFLFFRLLFPSPVALRFLSSSISLSLSSSS